MWVRDEELETWGISHIWDLGIDPNPHAAHRAREKVTAMEEAARTANGEASAQLDEAKAQLALAQANHAATPCTLNPEARTLHPETKALGCKVQF